MFEVIEKVSEVVEDAIQSTTATIEDITDIIKVGVLKQKVISWAEDRGIFDNPNAQAQLLKTLEELGELASDIAKGRDPRDSIGDVLVTLILQAHIQNTNFSECLEIAYNEISKRKGKMVDGIFVKEGD